MAAGRGFVCDWQAEPGVSLRQARTGADLVAGEMRKNYALERTAGFQIRLEPVAAYITAEVRPAVFSSGRRDLSGADRVRERGEPERLLTYAADAVAAFLKDLERIGRADDVVVMVFSEFDRRVPENVNLGTDHGTANLMFVAGKLVKGGHYGAPPSHTNLDAGQFIFTTDFCKVYATMISEWLGLRDTKAVLNISFEPFDLFRSKA